MQTTYSDQPPARIPGSRIAILQARWHQEHTATMVQRCSAVLAAAGCDAVEVHQLPGSLELPLAAQVLLEESEHEYDGIVCFGAIMKGDTYHFEMVADECTRGLGEVSRSYGVPIANEVLAVTNLDQLLARTADDERNKGVEAAHAIIEFIAWRRSLSTT